MSKRRIVELGKRDAVLRASAAKVTKFNRRLHRLLDDMADTMYAADGVGLAAPQVNESIQAVVIDVGDGLIELVNPRIIAQEGEVISQEACLSVPGRAGKVPRPEKVVVRAQNRMGEPFEIEAEELMAVCLCHEIDHLNGIVYVDKMIEEVFADDEDETEEITEDEE